ncbi:hypothetical protein LJC10_00575 [Selenomonadales bacterium OttesenSCG-928-I06]|nr:hypothetical protein [Selenomonadales bacterium OttesenSCG-928-I06]
MPDKDIVNVGEQEFKITDIYSIKDVRRAFRKALIAQEYRVGNRSVRRAELKDLWNILKAAESQEEKKDWDKYSGRSSRQVLMVD